MTSPHFKKKQVPHYFKQDFPDQRFFPFREYLHTRIVKDALPDISYFDQMYNKSSFKPQKKSRLSPERLNQVFSSKEKLYKKLFTNGEVDIRTDFQIQLSKTSAKPILESKADSRINILIRKGRLKSKKKTPLDMFVDPEKKRRVVSERKIPVRVGF
jgi:hypothetical protein